MENGVRIAFVILQPKRLAAEAKEGKRNWAKSLLQSTQRNAPIYIGHMLLYWECDG